MVNKNAYNVLFYKYITFAIDMDFEEQLIFTDINHCNDFGPMPPVGTDLAHSPLTKEQRLWLAMAVLSGQFKCRQLAENWHMKYKQVHKYAYRLKHGRIPAEKIGRPKILDAAGMDFISAKLQSGELTTRDDIKAAIDISSKDSKRRRHSEVDIDIDIESDERVSKRTRNRYTCAFIGPYPQG